MQKPMLIAALALGAGVAHAHDGLFYLGAGISRNKVSEITNGGAAFGDLDKTSWKVLAGFRPISLFAVEADYLDLGSQTNTFVGGANSHSDAKAFAGYAVGFLPIPVPFLDVYGKAGLARWKLDGASGSNLPPGNFFAFSKQGTEFAWGLGAQAHIGNIGGRLEYENFNIPNTSGAKVFSLAVILSLL
jgi:Outer membrane protein beta-barrel domain